MDDNIVTVTRDEAGQLIIALPCEAAAFLEVGEGDKIEFSVGDALVTLWRHDEDKKA